MPGPVMRRPPVEKSSWMPSWLQEALELDIGYGPAALDIATLPAKTVAATAAKYAKRWGPIAEWLAEHYPRTLGHAKIAAKPTMTKAEGTFRPDPMYLVGLGKQPGKILLQDVESLPHELAHQAALMNRRGVLLRSSKGAQDIPKIKKSSYFSIDPADDLAARGDPVLEYIASRMSPSELDAEATGQRILMQIAAEKAGQPWLPGMRSVMNKNAYVAVRDELNSAWKRHMLRKATPRPYVRKPVQMKLPK